MRRPFLIGLAASLLAIGLGLLGWRVMSAPTVLRIGVGPAGTEDARLIAAIAQNLSHEHETVRLKIVPTDGEAESAEALDEERVDLAVVRTDIAVPEKSQTIAILHRDAAVLVALPDRGIATLSDLRGHAIGIVRKVAANRQLLDSLLAHYEVPKDSVRVEVIETAAEVEEALRSRRVDAVLAIGSLGGRTLTETVAGAAAAGGAPPVFVPVSESEAIALRSPVYESLDIVRGAFGGAPPRPADVVKTLAVSHRLVGATSLEDATVSELTRLLFVMRPALAREVPLANRIEAPDVSKSSALPNHPGAAAYYEGEVQTFFERYDDWIYLGVMVLSIVGSAFAGLASTAGARRRARTLGMLQRLLGIVRLARAAESAHELGALEHECDEILGVALDEAGTGGLDDAGVSAFTLGLDQARHAIAARRAAIGDARPPLAAAAE